MDINSIYNNIFPLGGIDDNNSYVDLPGDKITSVQLIEPAIAVSKLGMYNKKDRKTDHNNNPDKYGYRIPIVSIDDYRVNQIDINAFKLDYTGFVPTVMVEFVDSSNSMLSTNVIKDGSILKVYIGGNGDELYYKPIRQDFVITSVKKSLGEDQNSGGYFAYKVYGKLNIPYGYRKEAWCGGESTAMQALFNLSVYTGLGFSTNFTNTNTLDSMNWRNNEDVTYFDFIEEVSGHACYSPNTFFTSFVDQYNVLNFVECHSLLSHGGKKTDVPAMIYNSFPPSKLPEWDGKTSKTTANQIPLRKGDTDIYNGQQKLSYYFLSNNEYYNGWSNFIDEYTEINNGGSSISSGYINHVSYSDSNSGWGFSVVEFKIRPIDNLKRDTSTQKIESIPDTPTQSSYIPINLMQTTKKEYQNSANDSVDCMTNVESFSSFGEVDTTNMFKQYYFAEVQNEYQMKCLKKCGLKVILQNYNPAITKFSRIWVDIYDKNRTSNTQIKESTINENDGDYKKYKEEKNKNILKFSDEGVIDEIDDEKRKNKNWPRGEYNRGLSGWYVITEIVIYYSPEENNLKMKLILNRIEYQPCFKDEYTIAKKAIDKYKEENIIDDIIISKDDLSYQN